MIVSKYYQNGLNLALYSRITPKPYATGNELTGLISTA